MADDKQQFTFIFEDKRKYTISSKQILCISSSFYYRHINNESKNKIEVPNKITYEIFDEFIKVIKEQISNENKFVIKNTTNILQFIELSEFFENDNFTMFLISEYIICDDIKINKNEAYALLIMSFNKLNKLNINDKYNNDEDLENTWLDLFLKSLEIVGINLLYFFEQGKLDIFDKKIIDELYEKFFMNLISSNYLINLNENSNDNDINNKKDDEIDVDCNTNIINKEEKNGKNSNKLNKKENIINLNTLRKMVEYLMNRRAQSNFFCLLSNEFMKISSEESLSEINALPNPTFLLKLDINDIENYYEEFEIENQINNEEQKVVVVINYKKIEDSFNISLKLANINKQHNKNNKNIVTNKLDILTFLTVSSIEELNVKQNNIKSISNNKSKQEIFKINNFSKLLSFINKKYLTLKIYLKSCFIHSMLCNYLFYDFENFYNNKSIYKITKNLLSIIIEKRFQHNIIDKNTDKVILCLLNWLDNEINIKENISEIIENIPWDNISLPLLFEFIIKCGKNISEKQLENIFLNSLKGRNQNYKGKENFNQYIMKSLFIASKNVDYITLFCDNIKMKKFKSYETINYERITQNENLQKNFNIKNKKYEQSNSIKNINKIDDNDSLIMENTYMKQNKSTSNLHYIKIDNSKKNEIVLNITKFNITNSSKEKINKQPKKISNIYYNNNINAKHIRNKTIDLNIKAISNTNKTAMNNNKIQPKIYFETTNNNKITNSNKNLYNNNKRIKYIKNKEMNDKKTGSKISLITELNKIKLKVKTNNQILQKNRKKFKDNKK
jgi:hypothetical protein